MNTEKEPTLGGVVGSIILIVAFVAIVYGVFQIDDRSPDEKIRATCWEKKEKEACLTAYNSCIKLWWAFEKCAILLKDLK